MPWSQAGLLLHLRRRKDTAAGPSAAAARRAACAPQPGAAASRWQSTASLCSGGGRAARFSAHEQQCRLQTHSSEVKHHTASPLAVASRVHGQAVPMCLHLLLAAAASMLQRNHQPRHL